MRCKLPEGVNLDRLGRNGNLTKVKDSKLNIGRGEKQRIDV